MAYLIVTSKPDLQVGRGNTFESKIIDLFGEYWDCAWKEGFDHGANGANARNRSEEANDIVRRMLTVMTLYGDEHK